MTKETLPTPLYAASINAVIGCLFKYIRSQAKIDQETVANAVGLSVSTISKIELGNLSITVEHIYILCKAYEIQNPFRFFEILEKAIEFLENKRVKVYMEKVEVQSIDKRTVTLGAIGAVAGVGAVISATIPSFVALATTIVTSSLLAKKKQKELSIMHTKQLYMLVEEFMITNYLKKF